MNTCGADVNLLVFEHLLGDGKKFNKIHLQVNVSYYIHIIFWAIVIHVFDLSINFLWLHS